MKPEYDVILHTDDGMVRCGPFHNMERAQEFIMSLDSEAFDYHCSEIIEHGAAAPPFTLVFRPAI